MIFCTLFDCNYLDKGIALYKSLERVTKKFKLYILAMDEECYSVLADLNFQFVELISLKNFEDVRLLQAKRNRSRGEYCWTCASSLIKYVLETLGEKICTYIDADCYFYSDPQVVLNEMGERHVQIIPHWFTNERYDVLAKKNSGTYCVEFNTFDNSKESLCLLNEWVDLCIGACSTTGVGDKFGDQGYIGDWDKYDCVAVVKNRGAGVAPWNIKQYKEDKYEKNVLIHKKTRKKYKLVFFHFHNVQYISRYIVKMNIYRYKIFMNYSLVYKIYMPYLSEIEEIRKMLEQIYGISNFEKCKEKECVIDLKKRRLIKRIKDISFIDLIKRIDHILTYEIPVKMNDKKDILYLDR